ncbi:MAG: glycosyltransferase [Chloroflexi bacterium]|nr:glycosyltransferase [Chloroflexota bacterium]
MILTYHKIHPENKTIWWVTPDSFYLQMADLRSKKVVYLDEYDPADPNQAVITFDGVYKDIWKYAVPILRHFGYPFELFIIGQTIGKDNSFDTGEPYAEFADVETLQKMVQAGGRLQWHSQSHIRLVGVTDLALYEKELTVPGDLRQLCPNGFKWYAYPHGQRDGLYRAQVESRFVGALACDDGSDADRYDLSRLTVYEETRFSNSAVSLIIPCYNYGHLAAEAIESALLQTCPPDEILFIDDASSDNSVEVARRYEPRIRVEVNEKNLGVVENFRKAVALTSGDYIVFLGADNRFRSDYIERAKAVLDSSS